MTSVDVHPAPAALEVTPDHLEALQEIMNVAIGRSSSALASLLDAFVMLSVPRIRVLPLRDLHSHLKDLVDDETFVVEQLFHGELSGQGLVLFSKEGLAVLLPQVFSDDELRTIGREQAETEMLLEVGNLVMSATAGTCAEQLHGSLTFCAPKVLQHGVSFDDDDDGVEDGGDRATLLMETHLETEEGSTRALVILVQDAHSNTWLVQALDTFLQELFG